MKFGLNSTLFGTEKEPGKLKGILEAIYQNVFGMLIYSLHNKSWFIPYVEKWLWYNSDNNEDVNDYNIEDLLYHYTKKGED